MFRLAASLFTGVSLMIFSVLYDIRVCIGKSTKPRFLEILICPIHMPWRVPVPRVAQSFLICAWVVFFLPIIWNYFEASSSITFFLHRPAASNFWKMINVLAGGYFKGF